MSDDPGDLYTPDSGGAMDDSADAFASEPAPTTFDGLGEMYGDMDGMDTGGGDLGGVDGMDGVDGIDGNVEVHYDGVQFDAGSATVDLTGDSVADTAVQDHGFQVEYYVDSSGDGVADELIINDPDGDLISHEVVDPATGEWIDVTGQTE